MPMQPRPIAETFGPPRPSFRCFIERNLTEENEGNEGLTEGGTSPSYLRYLCCLLYSSSDLSDPCSGRAFFPARADFVERCLVEGTLLEQFRVLFPALRFFRANDGGVNFWNAQGEAQRDRNAFLQIAVEEIVIQFSQTLPVFVMV